MSIKQIAILIASLALVVPNNLKGQKIKEFSSDPATYLQEFNQMLLDVNSSKYEDITEAYTQFWNTGPLNGLHKQDVIEIATHLLKRRAPASPTFTLFIEMQKVMPRIPYGNYEDWAKMMKEVASNPKWQVGEVNNVMQMTIDLVEHQYINPINYLFWHFGNTPYKIIVDGEDTRIKFEKMNLKGISNLNEDSLMVYNTQGTFHVKSRQWAGQGGMVTWENAGFGPDQVYAKLISYKLDMTKSTFTADTVKFYHKELFSFPLKGTLVDIMEDVDDPASAHYPKFQSFREDLYIEEILEDIDYEGGMAMEGAQMIGFRTGENYANITIKRKGMDLAEDSVYTFFRASSRFFVFQPGQIYSMVTQISFNLEEDSIYHPGLSMRYNSVRRELQLYRSGKGKSRATYVNNYHMVDMDCQLLRWNIDNPEIYFTTQPGAAVNLAKFGSLNLFDRKMLNYFGAGTYTREHPFQSIYRFCEQNKTKSFTGVELAAFMHVDISQLQPFLIEMSYYGMVSYDETTDKGVVMTKLYDYLYYRAQMKDYDVIGFVSDLEMTGTETDYNAILDLNTFDLKIFGIDHIMLSDSQNVVVRPQPPENAIVLRKNRDFVFPGQIQAGLFTYHGQAFEFSYDEFAFNLENVDSLQMNVLTGERDNYNRQMTTSINNVIENVNGKLYIDEPDNKSGRESKPEYPIFESQSNSYIYYDKPNIASGVYDRDTFYFEIAPFTLDSLDNFKTNGLGLEGRLVSGGIFPPIDERISVQEDMSMGFTMNTPPEGMPLYGGKGQYYNMINMSNQGLRGGGKFTYLTSTSLSNDFMFFIDSMNAHVTSFNIKMQRANQGPEYPNTQGKDAYIHWMPKQDHLYAKSKHDKFDMFDKQAQMSGTLDLSPASLNGWGRTAFDDAELISEQFTYRSMDFDADTAEFTLSAGIVGQALQTANVNATIDFVSRQGEFHMNESEGYVDFSINQYLAYVQDFNWLMDEERLDFLSQKTRKYEITEVINDSLIIREESFKGGRYVSSHPLQDSLDFMSPKSSYDLSNLVLTAEKVPFIITADAIVYPGDGQVTIEKKAIMVPLENAKLTVSRLNHYHNIFNAEASILGKHDYKGSGDYVYVDVEDQKQIIHFESITVDENEQTTASAEIDSAQMFTLSPHFDFRGMVSLEASIRDLYFDGYTRLTHNCQESFGTEWFGFATRVYPDNVVIPVGEESRGIYEEVNELGISARPRIYAGMYMSLDSVDVYSRFMNEKNRERDLDMFNVHGWLTYHPPSNTYRISDNKDKLKVNKLKGQYMSLHPDRCEVMLDGRFNFGTPLGQIKLDPSGDIIHNLNKNTIDFIDILLPIDFFMHEEALVFMANLINQSGTLEPMDIQSDSYKNDMLNFIDEESFKEMVDDMLMGALTEMPEELEHTMLLTNVNFMWYPEMGSFIADGEFGLSNILGTPINKKVRMVIEIQKSMRNSIMNIYIEIDKDNWFYFNYYPYTMQVISSNEAFNTFIKEESRGDRKQDVESGQDPYRYSFGAMGTKDKFLKRVREGIY